MLRIVMGLILCGVSRAAEVDASTPQAAAKSLAAAISAADAAAVRRLILIEHDQGQQLLGAYTNQILAAKRLGETLKKRFPGVSDPFASGGIAPEDAARIDAATVNINADAATLKLPGREQPMKLRQVDGAWKVIIAEEPENQTPEHRAGQLALIQGFADAMNGAADDVAAGKFRDVDEARNALKERLAAVAAKALQIDPPTTRPTSAPG
jgi:hypothetical protein